MSLTAQEVKQAMDDYIFQHGGHAIHRQPLCDALQVEAFYDTEPMARFVTYTISGARLTVGVSDKEQVWAEMEGHDKHLAQLSQRDQTYGS